MENTTRLPAYETDPDVWTVANLVVTAVSMIAQLASLRLQARSIGATGLQSQPTADTFDRLRDSVKKAADDVEKLIRLLGRLDPGPNEVHPLKALFRFGVARAYVDQKKFQSYRDLVSQIALDNGNISGNVLTLIQIDSSFTLDIVKEIQNRFGDIIGTINKMYQEPNRSIEDILSECFSMLKEFNTMLDLIERRRVN